MWRARADEVPVPVSLHLDHCPDREWITICLEAGWNSVLFDGSQLDVAENTRQTIEVVAEAERHGAQVEGEIESVLGVEDGVGSDEAGEVHPVEVSARVHRGDRRLLVRPGDRHRARPLQELARAQARARDRDRRAAPDPDGAARRHRADRDAVHRPDRARLRQGQHLDRAEDRVRRRPPRVPRGQPRQARSAVDAQATCATRSRRWPSTTSACSARPGAPAPCPRRPAERASARADLRLRRRAGRHRARRPPPGVQRDVRRGRPAGALVRAGVRARSSRSAAARSGWPRCSPPSSCAANGLPADPEGQKELLADWHRRKTARYKEMVRAGRLPGRPGIARIVERGDRRRAGRWRSPRPRPRSRSAPCSSTPSAPTHAARFAVFAGDIVPGQEARPGDLRLLALERLGLEPRRRDRDRGLAQRPARGGRRRAALRGHRLQLHRRGGHERGGAGGHQPRRPRRAGASCSPTAAARGPGELVTLADLDACRTQPLLDKEAV